MGARRWSRATGKMGIVRWTITAGAALALLLARGGQAPIQAQLPSASAEALGLSDNYTAVARGYDVIAWNPANLGLRAGPTFSLTLPSARFDAALDPVGLGDLDEYEDRFVPLDVKKEWLRRIRENGGQSGTVAANGALAFSVGPVAVQLSSDARSTIELNPDGAEIILFGNVDPDTDEPRDLSSRGSILTGTWTSSIGVAWGMGFDAGGGLDSRSRFAVGATVKYTWGHALFRGEDAGSGLESDPLSLRIDFPIVQTDTAGVDFDNGSGIGVDLGGAWENGRWTAGLVLQNVVSTFAWSEDELFYRPGEALFDADSSSSDFDARPIAERPELADFLEELEFEPIVGVGVGYEINSRLLVAMDFRRRLGEGIPVGPRTHLGAGLRYQPIGALTLRGGAAAIPGGFQYAGGVGFDLGPVELAGAAARRTGELGEGLSGMITLSLRFR